MADNTHNLSFQSNQFYASPPKIRLNKTYQHTDIFSPPKDFKGERVRVNNTNQSQIFKDTLESQKKVGNKSQYVISNVFDNDSQPIKQRSPNKFIPKDHSEGYFYDNHYKSEKQLKTVVQLPQFVPKIQNKPAQVRKQEELFKTEISGLLYSEMQQPQIDLKRNKTQASPLRKDDRYEIQKATATQVRLIQNESDIFNCERRQQEELIQKQNDIKIQNMKKKNQNLSEIFGTPDIQTSKQKQDSINKNTLYQTYGKIRTRAQDQRSALDSHNHYNQQTQKNQYDDKISNRNKDVQQNQKILRNNYSNYQQTSIQRINQM